MTRSGPSRARGAARRTTAAAGALALLLALVACTGDDDPESAATSSGPTSTPPETASTTTLDRPDATWDVSLEQLGGGVDKKQRRGITAAIQRSVASWAAGGFGGAYPRDDFSAAFARWTPQAASMGKRDRAVTTNAALGTDLVDVVADRRQARIFVFAAHGYTGGATARVFLRYTGAKTTGDLVAITVKGDLRLSRDGARWRIFGYDLDRWVEAR